MPLPGSHIQPLVCLGGRSGMTIWGYATKRCLSEVESLFYFDEYRRQFDRGDLLMVNHRASFPTHRPPIQKILYHVDKDLEGRVRLHELLRFALPDDPPPL
jgi:hypothetical protein